MKQLLSVIGAIAVPVFSKLVIPENVSFGTQIIMLTCYFLTISTIFAGVYYFRYIDLTQRILEIKMENNEKLTELKSIHTANVSELNKKISDLENNREALKNMLSNNKDENNHLKALLAIYAFTIPHEKRKSLEQAASLYIGGTFNEGESD